MNPGTVGGMNHRKWVVVEDLPFVKRELVRIREERTLKENHSLPFE